MIHSSQPGSQKPTTISTKQKAAASVKPVTEEELLRETEEDLNKLRPKKLTDYIGQDKVVRQLKLILDSANIRDSLPEHVLFYGQPGLGKTTLANLISTQLKSNFKVISAPALQKVGDVVSLLVNLEPRSVLFIDEIHRLKAPLEETLYTAMEDRQVDILMGKGQGANSMRLDLNPFILVGATTQLGKLSKPLKDRFANIFHLEPYSDGDMLSVVDRSSNILKLKMDDQAKLLVCRRSRGVPRIANNILKRFVDLQTVHKIKQINYDQALDFLEELGIFESGLTKPDLTYLNALLSGSVSLKTMSGILLEETETLEYVTEPYLIHLGFLDKSSEGRKLTPKGREFILKLTKQHPQEEIFNA
jgi:holliday junction DNA helicase RuvB